MNVFKSVTIAYVDATGKRVSKDTPGARKKRIISENYYGRYVDATGKLRTVSLKVSDKKAAQKLLSQRITNAQLELAGLADYRLSDFLKTPLSDHLELFKQFLSNVGRSQKHVSHTYARTKAIIDGCKFQCFRDIDASAVQAWLAERRKLGTCERCRPTRYCKHCHHGMSIQTGNLYLQAVKQFCRYIVRGKGKESPLTHLQAGNVALDKRHERRVLSPADFAIFLSATTQGKPYRELSGQDRSMLYFVACNTGLRASELASLKPAAFQLDTEPPTVTLKAAYSKRRRADVQPIGKDLAIVLKVYLAEKPADQPIWPGTWTERAGKMVRIDLATASAIKLEADKNAKPIQYRDDEGRVFDFHSLRHQFITSLALAGVHPKIAQQLARHSDITLTMKTYTHLELSATASALEKLPACTDFVQNQFASVAKPSHPCSDSEGQEPAKSA